MMTKIKQGFHLVPCTGEAHSNPHIDSCGICAPRWGEVEVPIEFSSLADYRAAATNPGPDREGK